MYLNVQNENRTCVTRPKPCIAGSAHHIITTAHIRHSVAQLRCLAAGCILNALQSGPVPPHTSPRMVISQQYHDDYVAASTASWTMSRLRLSETRSGICLPEMQLPPGSAAHGAAASAQVVESGVAVLFLWVTSAAKANGLSCCDG